MMKRKEFMLGAVAGLAFAAAATAGGVIDWPTAEAGPVAGVSGRLAPSAGAGLAFAPPQGAPLSFADIFQQVAPAVVQIDVKTRVARQPGMIQIPGTPFAIPSPNGGDQEGEDGADGDGGATALGAGSGFFIAANGFIVTNNHVVADAIDIKVKLADGRELDARLVGRDEATDLAVIKVEGTDFPFVNFEETAQPRVGDWVIAVGNPFGLGGTATAGIVSASGRGDIDNATPYTDYLQIDAAINRGNSGGPTFDIYGRVIGVNSAIYSPTGGSVGIGFAIPATVAKPITDRLMRGESIARGYVGVGIQNLTREQIAALGQSPDFTGAWVGQITPDGPADKAGLQINDVVTKLNGQPVRDRNDLTRRIGSVEPGQTIRLEVLRDGRLQTVNVRAGARPSQAELNADPATPGSGDREAPEGAGVSVGGLTVAPMSDVLRRRYSIPANINGLVVTAQDTVGELRFRPGFVITNSAAGAIRTPADFEAAIAAARRANRGVFLVVWTPDQGSVPVVLDLPKPE
ncbi:MAG: PDZ domain-containing protein [Brevundimonas sp.]|nr:MAG: PDZ domain-containing protein [Brevundimonas sp.]